MTEKVQTYHYMKALEFLLNKDLDIIRKAGEKDSKWSV